MFQTYFKFEKSLLGGEKKYLNFDDFSLVSVCVFQY